MLSGPWRRGTRRPEHLWHFSEDPAIERFVPHVPATNPEQPPMVWTVDDVHAPLFWFPRDCPRITFWADDGSPPDRLGATTAARVHAIEEGWLERVQSVRALGVPVRGRRVRARGRTPTATGCPTTSTPPLDVAPVGDLLERHRERGIELRVLPDLRELRDAGDRVGLPVLDVPHGTEHQSCSGRSVGNRMTSRIDVVSVSSITRRSMPMPRPAVGGRPYSRARR